MRATTVVAAAVLVATCAVAARVVGAAEGTLTGSQTADDILAGRVQRIGVAPGFEIYAEGVQVPPGVITKFNRAMWKVIQKIDPWNLPGTLARWPMRIFYLGSETLRRLGSDISTCQSECGRTSPRAVYLNLSPILLEQNFSRRGTLDTVTHEMTHFFVLREVWPPDSEIWVTTEFPGWSPGLIVLGRWMVGRVNERHGSNPTPLVVSEERYNQILRLAREETFVSWPETALSGPSYQGWQTAMLYPRGDGKDEIRAAMDVVTAIVWTVDTHQPGTNNFFASFVAGIVAEVEAECARDNAC